MRTNIVEKNVTWITVSQFGLIAIQIINILIVTRLIGVGDVGLFAVALSALNVSLLLRDLGTSMTVIQKKKITVTFLCSIHTINILSGYISTLIMLIVAPILSVIYQSKDLGIILLLAGLSVSYSSYGQLNYSLLQKESEFDKIARIDLTSTVIGSITGIIAALLGLGVYALALNFIITNLISSTLFIKSKNNEQVRFWYKLNYILAVAKKCYGITSYNIIHFVTKNCDVFLIGYYFGAYKLGIYVMGLKFMMMPYQLITVIVNKSIHPILSSRKTEKDKVFDSYIAINKIVILLSGSFVTFLLIFRHELISILLDPKWANLTDTLLYLLPSGFLLAVASLSNIYLIILDNEKLLMKFGIFEMLLIVGAIVASSFYNYYTMLLVLFIVNLSLSLLIMVYTARSIHAYNKNIFLNYQSCFYRIILLFLLVSFTYNLSSQISSSSSTNAIFSLSFGLLLAYILVYRSLIRELEYFRRIIA